MFLSAIVTILQGGRYLFIPFGIGDFILNIITDLIRYPVCYPWIYYAILSNMNYNLRSEQSTKKGYGIAALIVSLIPIMLFPVFILIPLLSLAFSLLAIILGALSINSPRKASAISGLVLGLIGFTYMTVLLLGVW